VLAFLAAMIRLSCGKPQKLDSRIFDSALHALLWAVLGCPPPVEKGILFGQTESMLFLILGTALRVLVLVIGKRAGL
jgi:hypothetical protein